MFFCVYAKAQAFPELKFSHITEKEGLSTKEAECITQDKDGFIWVGTFDGLNRLDGYRVKTFFHIPANPESLVNSYVTNLLSDTAGNIWVSTSGGISYFNKMQSRFIHFPGSVFSKREAFLSKDHNNTVWIVCGDSVFTVDKNMKCNAKLLNTSDLHIGIITRTTVFGRLNEDMDGHFWTYALYWVFKINDEAKTTGRSFYTGNSLVTSIYHDVTNQCWIGTFGNGLLLLNEKSGRCKKISLANNAKVVRSLCEWKDKNNRKWLVIGTENGLVLLDALTLDNYTYASDTDNDNALHGKEVHCVFTDRENILWVATDEGINYVEPIRQLIDSWNIDGRAKRQNNAKQGYLYSFYFDSSGYLGSNWEKPGLNFYSKTGQLIKTIPNLYPANPDSLKNETGRAFSIIKQKDGTFWFTTNMGLIHFNPTKQTFILHKPPGTSNSTGLRRTLPYSDSIWWIRTSNNMANGVYVFNANQQKFTAHYYVRECDTCAALNLYDILITKNREVYVTTLVNGLFKFEPSQDKFAPIPIHNLPAEFNGICFECLTEGRDGMIWVGTLNGLFEFNPITKTVIKDFSTDKKIGGVDIFKLCLDDSANVWMNTGRGVFCLVHHSGEILRFNAGDGFPSDYMPGFLSKGTNGYMYAGAFGYIVKFKPYDLLHHKVYAQVHFSEVSVMDKPYAMEQDGHGNNTITLSPGQDYFSVDYAVLNYDNPAGNRYFYKLDGANGEWNENENGHLSFYNLPAGNYTLHLRGGHKFGGQFNSEAILFIQVLPFWWQTILFKCAVAAVFMLLAFIFVIRRISTIKKEAQLKHKIAETEMAALRAQMNPHFIFNCLNSIDNLIQKNQKEKATTYLSKFAKLIRAILENSTFDMIPCWKELECLQLYVDLEMLRLGEKFSCTFFVDEKIYKGDYEMPPTILQPFVENAIHHGLLNKLDDDKKLTVTTVVQDNNIKFIIEDNGIGRAQAEMYKKINNPKYQSLGVKITGDRIHYFNKEADTKLGDSIIITDLFENGAACGTRVEILLKN